ncbi:MAG: acetolactate synthase small subunit [Ekhidna sp.]|nr:acetolactate synthase small subunit [Ekhidna sp.]
MKQKEYTISILTEDKPGLLNKITIIFNRRKINIASLNVSTTEVAGVSRYTLVVSLTPEEVEKIIKQIRRVVEVLGSFYYEEDEIYYREIALYKFSIDTYKNNNELEQLIRNHGAKVMATEEDQVVIEKTGTKQETHELYNAFQPFDLMEFVRSGRIALSKSKRRTEAFIHELETSTSNTLSIKEF